MEYVEREASESEDSNVPDSSDENDEEEEEEQGGAVEGLINDDTEESDGESSSDESITCNKRRNDSESEDIMEDDLELIKENTGVKIKKKHKRIKIDESDDEGEELEQDSNDGEERNFTSSRQDYDEDEDDFIVEDDDNMASSHKRDKKKAIHYANENMQEAMDIFGVDFEDLQLEEDEDEDDDGYIEREDKKKEESEPMFEPADEMKYYRRKEDHVIRQADAPERFQIRDTPIQTATEDELKQEAEWIFTQLYEKKKLSKQDGFWQLYFGHGDRTDVPSNDKLQERIEKVLLFIRNHQFEIPFIEHYRKEYVKPEISENEMWQIYELDEKYMQLTTRRENLKNLFQYMQDFTGILVQKEDMMPPGLRSVTDEDIDKVDRTQSFEELKDLQSFFSLYYSQHTEQLRFIAKQQNALQKVKDEGGDEEKQREAVERVQRGEDSRIYRVAKRKTNLQKFYEVKLDEVADKFGLSAEKVAENFKFDYLRNEVEQCDQFPLEIAKMYLCNALKTPEIVLNSAKQMLALQISHEPDFRNTIRENFRDKCLITCKPTETGLKTIEAGHSCYTHRYLKNKPVKSLVGAMFLRIHQAKKDNLLEYRLHIDPINESNRDNENRPWFKPYFEQVKHLFHNDEFTDLAEQWNQERVDVLKKSIEIISPVLYREIEYLLLQESYDVVTIEVAQKVFHDLKIGRYKPTVTAETENTIFAKVLGISYDPEEEGSAAFGAFVDSEGEVTAHLRLPNLVRQKRPNSDDDFTDDLRNLLEFMRAKEPNVVAIGCDSRDALDIKKDVEKLINRLSDEEGILITVEMMPTKYAKVFSKSDNAKEQFSEYPPVLLQAISTARYLQDPIIELCQLCNFKRDILSVPYHSNQTDVPQDMLMKRVEYEFINRVNQVGVDINQCIAHPHTAYQLQFVAGFGPRKSVYIRQMLKYTRMENRSQLVTHCHAGPKVFINCAGFIKIDTNAMGDTTDSYVEVLDGSRVHPETYEWARKMAIDALEYDDSAEGANPASALEEILEAPDRLRDLDLDAFADELQRQGYGIRHTTLYDIRKELTNRYEDTREDYQAPTIDEIFNWVTKETPDIFFIGKIVDARVTSVAYRRPGQDEIDGANPTRSEKTGLWACPLCHLDTLRDLKEMWNHHDSGQCPGRPRGVNVILDNGCRGFIPIQQLSDNQVTDPNSRVRRAQVVHGRILKIDPERFWVELTTRTSDLVDAEGKWELRKDKYYDYELEQTELESQKNKKTKVQAKKYMRRLVTHDQFRNIDYNQACKMMENVDQGEAIFRPSSKSNDHLSVTIKLTTCGILLHLDITEQDKEHEFTLGKRLFINKEEYEDLDEIMARCVAPLTSYVRELENFKYFLPLDLSMDEKKRIAVASEKIGEEKRAQPERIFYHIVASKDMPGYFLLIYQPRSRIHYEYVKATPNGLRYRNRLFQTLSQLLKYFKENYKNPPPSMKHY